MSTSSTHPHHTRIIELLKSQNIAIRDKLSKSKLSGILGKDLLKNLNFDLWRLCLDEEVRQLLLMVSKEHPLNIMTILKHRMFCRLHQHIHIISALSEYPLNEKIRIIELLKSQNIAIRGKLSKAKLSGMLGKDLLKNINFDLWRLCLDEEVRKLLRVVSKEHKVSVNLLKRLGPKMKNEKDEVLRQLKLLEKTTSTKLVEKMRDIKQQNKKTIAFIGNLLYLMVLIPMYFNIDESIKKSYAFIISRCISSIFAIFAIILMFFLRIYTKNSNYYLVFLIILVDDMSFYSLLGSYVNMSILIYFASIYPMYYSQNISLRRIYHLIAINWTISIFISILSSLFQASTFSINGPIKCDEKTCGPIVDFITYLIILISFSITILTMLFVLVNLIWRHKNLGNQKEAVKRLFCTLVIFTIFALTEAIPSTFLIGQVYNNIPSNCQNFYNSQALITSAIWTSLQTLAWSIALCADPLLGICFDSFVNSRISNFFKNISI
ncbi:unnamed protein product [Caenorhabditis angaria]|uniref:G-protein coupled receptors family 1 profile domain-containing protein n=1 Tax=Caenorhabditis angaria TaxID=860376 RepID=A0A9P1IKV7_9PELO|nr:unnamed protein product [Caenorhabditis angaria]